VTPTLPLDEVLHAILQQTHQTTRLLPKYAPFMLDCWFTKENTGQKTN